MTELKDDLFRIAMDALVEIPVRDRRATAALAAALAADSGSPPKELDDLVGPRAAAALRARVASERRAPRVTAWAPGRQPKVAISTAEETLGEAEQLRDELGRLGALVWLYTNIPLGRHIIDEAEHAMTTHDYVVLIASQESEASEWVKFETALVRQAEFSDRRDRLLPVRVGVRTRDLRPFLRLPRSVEWGEAGGAYGVAQEIWQRVDADRRRSK